MAPAALQEDREADPFAIPSFSDLSETTRFAKDDTDDGWISALQLPPREYACCFSKRIELMKAVPRVSNDDVFGKLPQPDVALDVPSLDELRLEPLAELRPAQLDAADTHPVHNGQSINNVEKPADVDLWDSLEHLAPLSAEPRFLTWETFIQPARSSRPRPLLLSEAGPAAFDACLLRAARRDPRRNDAGTPVQVKPLLRSLWQLCLGHESVLFSFDPVAASFKPCLDKMRGSGYSLECAQDSMDFFVDIGNAARLLKAFAERSFADTHVGPATVSLGNAVDAVLKAVEAYMATEWPNVRTVLQLQSLALSVQRLLIPLKQLVDLAASSNSDEQLLDRLFDAVGDREHVAERSSAVLERVIARASSNWLSTISTEIGLAHWSPMEKDADQDGGAPGYSQSFISAGDLQLIAHTKECLHYVKEQHPEHVLVNNPQVSTSNVELSWEFEWVDLERLEQKASQYRQDIVRAIKDHSHGSSGGRTHAAHKALAAHPAFTFEAFQEDMLCFDDGESFERTKSEPTLDVLFTKTLDYLSPSADQSADTVRIRPPFSLTPSLSLRSLLLTQNFLLSYATVHSILHEQHVRSHLEIHHTFSLFASGLFSARLQHVLFSSETESAERQRDVLRTGGSSKRGGMGLKLGTDERQAWPPASSEVRLTLMGLLSDCWREERNMNERDLAMAKSSSKAKVTEDAILGSAEVDALPGNLSFAIRTDLSDETVEKILDANGIAALDFLRLTYEPLRALSPIFSARSLELYDRIFALWLRLIRISSTLSTIFELSRRYDRFSDHADRSSQRQIQSFHHEARFFFTTVTSHFRIAGIEAPWSEMIRQIDSLSASCADPCPPDVDVSAYAGVTASMPSLASLRSLHDATLAAITGNLLLRKKQRYAADALEGACNDVLAFARSLRQLVALLERGDPDGEKRSVLQTIRELQQGFRARVQSFRTCCADVLEGERQKKGFLGSDDVEYGERCVLELLVGLEGFRDGVAGNGLVQV